MLNRKKKKGNRGSPINSIQELENLDSNPRSAPYPLLELGRSFCHLETTAWLLPQRAIVRIKNKMWLLRMKVPGLIASSRFLCLRSSPQSWVHRRKLELVSPTRESKPRWRRLTFLLTQASSCNLLTPVLFFVEMCSFTPLGQQIISQNVSKKMSQEIFIKLYWGSILMTSTTKGR